MKVLGFDTYVESFTDGLQVLRYNKTTAYIVSFRYVHFEYVSLDGVVSIV